MPALFSLQRLAFCLVVLLASIPLQSQPASAQDFLGIGGGTDSAEAEASTPEAPATPLETLVELLRDDTARQALIADLEAQIAGETAEDPAEAAAPSENVISLGGQIADVTEEIGTSAVESVQALTDQITAIPGLFGALGSADYARVGWLALDLVLLVSVVYGVLLLSRYFTENFRRALNQRARRSGRGAALLAVLVLLISNLFLVFAAWAVGHVLALAVLGNAGRMDFHHALFLNAFLVVEVFQAVVRAMLAPRRPELRFVPLSDATATMLTTWFRVTVTVLAFTQLLLVPVFNRFVSSGAAQAVSVIGFIITLSMLVNLVLRIREPISAWLSRRARNDRGGMLTFIGRYWHVPVLAYLVVLFFVVVIWPGDLLISMIIATGQILLAIWLGFVIAGLLSRLILSGVKLPGGVNDRIPLLEQRLNSFVPRALTVLRILVVVVVVAFALNAIGLFSLEAWLASEFGGRVSTAIITVALILTIAFAAWLALSSWVDYRLEPHGTKIVTARERTLLVLLRNAVTVTITVFAGMFALSEIGIDIAPLLASAGVIGLAIGFGAQKLVQDIITGIFIQLEGAIDVGDVVNIGGISGSVEKLTIRSAGLRDVNGVYHIVPFSSVTIVSNFMRGFAFALCDMSVAYRENLEEVKAAMFEAYEEVRKDETIAKDLVEPTLEWMGVEKFMDSAVVVRARIKTLPGRQWAVQRAYNAAVKRTFDAHGIEMPFPHQTVYFGSDKKGQAAPLHLVTERPPRETPPPSRAENPGGFVVKPTPSRAPEVPDADDFEAPDQPGTDRT